MSLNHVNPLKWLGISCAFALGVIVAVLSYYFFLSFLSASSNWLEAINNSFDGVIFCGALGALKYRHQRGLSAKSNGTIMLWGFSIGWGVVLTLLTLQFGPGFDPLTYVHHSFSESLYFSYYFGLTISIICFVPLEWLKK